MNKIREYREIITNTLLKIEENELDKIEKAAEIASETILKDKFIYVFGTGHSMALALEVFYRAGGLVPIYPIFDLSISALNGALKSTALERLSGYGKILIDYYKPSKESTLIIVSTSGKNSVPIEMAIEAKNRGINTIGVTSLSFSKNVPIENPYGKRLFEVVDIAIDDHVPLGDAVLEIKGIKQKFAPISTIINSFILHSIMIKTIEKIKDKGIKPPIWTSGNVPEGMESNKQYIEKYYEKIKHL